MQHVRLIDNPLEPGLWEEVEVEDVRAFLVEHYATWPPNARIYHGLVGDDHDVTPTTEGDVERLATLDDLTVIIFPEGPTFIIVALIIAVVAVVALMFLLPAIPDLRNTQTSSANNSLSNRGNRARPNARIPDILGQVRSIPDMLAVPYRVFENHREVEISYMCVGRGAYDIGDVRDGDTLIADIDGSSVAVYGPNSSPNSGASPQLQIGTAISDPLFSVVRLNEVNGQVLKAPNDTNVRADQEIRFKDGGIVEAAGGAIDFTTYFHPGDPVDIGAATDIGVTDPASAIFAAATGTAPNKLSFAGFDPSAHFTVGSKLVIDQAVWTYSDPSGTGGGGGGGGTLGGGTTGGGGDNPDFPASRFDVPLD